MKIIEIENKTEYFAKKHCLDAMVEYFQSNEKTYFVGLVAKWCCEVNKVQGMSEIVARREIVSAWVGLDFVKSKKRNLTRLQPVNKEEYLELWAALETQQAKETIKDFASKLIESKKETKRKK